ncbi:hypothetical protein [Edwardsiella piscicida]|uniref:hypothetical protein n=1 Tax=Edwardsiella piscicida TaxID=1263550 RepID=UPI0020C91F26|nr:hypothetical protein [Edwardsiella piscicida]WAM46186.1 hypothetical protein NMC32_08065 [Edwardsiella piscicida]
MKKVDTQGFVLSPYSQRKILRALGEHQKKIDSKLKKPTIPLRYNSITGEYDNLVTGKYGPLILKVRRGKIVSEKHYCAECGCYISPIRAYADSNYGKVYLCTPCHLSAFERAFGHADAMPLRLDHAHAHKGKW